MKKKLGKPLSNDLSFELDGKLIVFMEHQSTIDENMPLRMLNFVTYYYKSRFGVRDAYEIKKLPLQRPEFVVLYNGVKEMPEDMIELRLSDMFVGEKTDDAPNLELVVKMYNVNRGRNIDIVKRCVALNGYTIFVDKVRAYQKNIHLKDAIKQAVVDCIKENILKDFFENHKQEVVNMFTEEWDQNVALEVAEERGIREGALRAARILKAKGVPTATIIEATGLTFDDILPL